jgi:hypothetical protein
MGPRPAVFIPVGGRKKFVAVYNGGLDDRVYVLAQDDPAAGRVSGCSPTTPGTPLPLRTVALLFFGMKLIKLPPAEVNFTFTNPTIPHPFSGGGVALPPLPLVEREINPCDPDFSGDRNNPNVFYLRGVRSAVGNEGLLTVTATRSDPVSGTSRGEAKVLVAEGDLGRAPGGAVIEGAISTAAATAGIPPQFLKAQVEKETNFEPDRIRYEAMGIDFKNLSRDGAPHRANAYVARHLISGPAASTTDVNACLVVVGQNASPVATTIQGCPAPVAYAAPIVIGGVGGLLIRGRVGMPADSNFRTGAMPTAWRYTPSSDPAKPPTAQQLTPFQEAPYWSHAGSGGTATVNQDEFQVNYATNELRLGRPLAQGEWLRLNYRVLRPDPSPTAGACIANDPATVQPFDVTKLTNKSAPPLQRLDFQPGDTIGGWLKRNIRSTMGGFNWLDDGTLNTRIEFRARANGTPYRGSDVAVIDRRLDMAQAQFVAGTSFGLTQMTLLPWIENAPGTAEAVLNKAFDLNSRCLQELMADPANPADAGRVGPAAFDSALVAAALHTYNRTRVARPGGVWDQEQWAKHWAEVFRLYNSGGKEYCTTCKHAVNGLSRLIRRGLSEYDPSAQGCNREFGATPCPVP